MVVTRRGFVRRNKKFSPFVFDGEFGPGAGLEDTAVVVVMAIGDVSTREGEAPMRDVVVEFAVQQEHRSEVSDRTIGMVELPYPITERECPGGTETGIDTVLQLEDEFMPQIIEVA